MKIMMNEKIQQLIKQAGADSSGKWMSIEQAHKLAELIINECYIAVENTNTSHVYTTFDEGQFKATIIKCKEAIKKHFGV